MRGLSICYALLGACLLPALSWAQGYPARPVTIVSPYGAGGNA